MELKQNITYKKVRFYYLEQDDEENYEFREVMECDATIAVGDCIMYRYDRRSI